jgi:hypothetical protein
MFIFSSLPLAMAGPFPSLRFQGVFSCKGWLDDVCVVEQKDKISTKIWINIQYSQTGEGQKSKNETTGRTDETNRRDELNR